MLTLLSGVGFSAVGLSELKPAGRYVRVMEFVWSGKNDSEGSRSHKRAAKACRPCRQRKKRCFHENKEESAQATSSTAKAGGTRPDVSASSERDDVHAEFETSEPIVNGDKHPESILADLAMSSPPHISKGTTHTSQSKNSWKFSQNRPTVLPTHGLNLTFRISDHEYKVFGKARREFSLAQRSALEDAGAFRTLPNTTTTGLLVAYLSCMNEIFPIVDGAQIFRDYSIGKFSKPLIQAMCMVASKSEQAKPHLRLEQGGPLLRPLTFARILFNGLDAAMRADMERDSVIKIQILCLMHLHNDGPGGVKEASLFLTQAIHEAFSIRLHFLWPGRTVQDQYSLLWWCLRNFDKINSCIHGGPRVINDQDIDLPEPTPGSEYCSQTISLLTRLGTLISQALEVYRASHRQEVRGIEKDFPEFSDLVHDIEIDTLQASHRDFLEVCYHVAAMLSCRSSNPGTVAYTRRLRSADRVHELTRDSRWSHLPPVPIIPYAVSLSLTVGYRALVDSEKAFDIAYQDFSIRCETLRGLSANWWTARGMAALSDKVRSRINKQSQLQDAEASTSESNTFEHASFNRASTMFSSSSQPDFQPSPSSDTTSFGPTTSALWTIEADPSTNLDHLFDDLFNIEMPMINQDTSFWGPLS